MHIKHLIVAAIAALGIAGNAMAQEKKTEISVYTDMSSSSSGSSASQTSMTYLSVGFGRYITPNLVLKGTVSEILTDSNTSTSNIIGLSGGARYYFRVGKTGDWVPFGGAGLKYSSMYTWTSTAGGTTTSGTGLMGEGGVAYYITENASLDLRAYVESLKYSNASNSTSTVGLQLGATFRF
jgi:outer membrane protein W